MFEALHRKLERTQTQMKSYADSNRWEVSFKIGDWVYVKLRPYHQTSIADKFQKLGKPYYGPYQITNLVKKSSLSTGPTTNGQDPPCVSLLQVQASSRPISVRTFPPSNFMGQ